MPAARYAQMCILSLLDHPPKDRVVADFADTLFDKRAAMGTNLQAALANFENTMKFDSAFEAEPRIAKALLETAIAESASYFVGGRQGDPGHEPGGRGDQGRLRRGRTRGRGEGEPRGRCVDSGAASAGQRTR